MTHVDIAATIAPEDKLSKTLLNDIKTVSYTHLRAHETSD